MEVTARVSERDVFAVRLRAQNTSGRTATLWLSKIGDIPIRYHRPIPDNATIKEVTLKKETTGEWHVTFGLDVEDATLPEKIDVDDLDAEDCVGIDLGITNYIYTSDGDSVDWLDLTDEYERLRREQRSLSRKEHGSNNWEKQRRAVATVKRRLKRKVEDFQHKLTMWLVKEYDAVFVEELNVAGMLQSRGMRGTSRTPRGADSSRCWSTRASCTGRTSCK